MSLSRTATTYQSFCKINLGLEILRKREDGYHDINTVFYRLNSPYDTILVSESEEYELTISDRSIASDSSNLITKAFSAVAELKGISLPKLKIELEKVVPHGAGLGGGSANAAVAIKIFSDMVSELTESQKFRVASFLGADVAFFLKPSRLALASGKGEILTPSTVSLPYTFLVVKYKEISIPTAEAYRNLSLKNRDTPTDLLSALTSPIGQWKDKIVNDFEPYAFRQYPELSALKQQLYTSGAEFALMSGSGSALFGVYSNNKTAEEAFESLKADRRLQVFITVG